MNTNYRSNDSKNEYDNPSHIVKKQKAESQQFQKKNLKKIVELLDEEDAEIAEKYARYVK